MCNNHSVLSRVSQATYVECVLSINSPKRFFQNVPVTRHNFNANDPFSDPTVNWPTLFAAEALEYDESSKHHTMY